MKILVTAEQFGYGPIATCLNVIKELKKYDDVILTFAGTGISLEQAKMTDYFDSIVECKTYDEKELKNIKDLILEHDVVLSSENVPGARYALEIGHKRVYYIDNLMWMWDEIHPGLENLKGYIISESIPCKENFSRIGEKIKNPIFVGPLRDMNVRNNGKKENKLIINIGGAEAFIIDSNIVKKFYQKLINGILNNHNFVNKFDKIIVCGGSGVINSLKLDNTDSKITVSTLSNENYLRELDTCSHCIMASGLGNFFETLWRDKTIMYLPPVNYSQLLQLEYYEKMNLGFNLVNWSNFTFYKEVPSLMNEEAGVDLVIENVKKYIDLGEDNTIEKSIERFMQEDQSAYYHDRNKYIEALEKNGNEKVAEIIYKQTKGEIK